MKIGDIVVLRTGDPQLFIKITNLDQGLVAGISLRNKKEGHWGLPSDFQVVLHLSL